MIIPTTHIVMLEPWNRKHSFHKRQGLALKHSVLALRALKSAASVRGLSTDNRASQEIQVLAITGILEVETSVLQASHISLAA